MTEIGFDVETTSPKRGKALAVQECRVVGYSVAWDRGKAAYTANPPATFIPVLTSPAITKVCHNAKFEHTVLANMGVSLQGFEDTKLAAYLLDYPSTHLKDLVRQELGRDPISYSDVTGRGAGHRDMSELSGEEIYEYAAADADNTLILWGLLRRHLEAEGLMRLYREVELPLIPVLSEMERAGVCVEEERIKRLEEEWRGKEESAASLACHLTQCNIFSDSQLSAALERLGLPIKNRTEARRQLSTAEADLLSVREANPALVDAVLEARGWRKLRAYLNGFLELRGTDGRLHPAFNQAGYWEEASEASKGAPLTGRLSCSSPNLQNIPNLGRSGAIARDIRNCITASAEHVLISGDIGQEEVRIAALVCPVLRWQEVLNEGGAIYGEFGEAVYGRKVQKANHPLEWDTAKKSILSFIWGSEGGASWAQRLTEMDGRISKEEGLAAYARLLASYPEITEFKRRVQQQLVETGVMTDWFGRKRWFPKVWLGERSLKKEAHREAMNFLIQAPAATIIKMMMLRVAEGLRGMAGRLILSVHDEVVIEAPTEELDEVADLLYNCTKGLMPIQLPIEVKVGKSWGQMVRYGD